jgi:hypothetical protein
MNAKFIIYFLLVIVTISSCRSINSPSEKVIKSRLSNNKTTIGQVDSLFFSLSGSANSLDNITSIDVTFEVVAIDSGEIRLNGVERLVSGGHLDEISVFDNGNSLGLIIRFNQPFVFQGDVNIFLLQYKAVDVGSVMISHDIKINDGDPKVVPGKDAIVTVI